MSKEAMKLALEALKRMKRYGNTFGYRSHEQNPYEQVCEAITALEALAEQPAQQEPKTTNQQIIEWADRHDLKGTITDLRSAFEDAKTVYTAPQPPAQPSKPLTDEHSTKYDCMDAIRARSSEH